MAIYYNPNTYDIGAAEPIDSRFTKGTIVLRDAIPSAVRYEGLTVYVVATGLTYTLVGGIADINWTTSSSLGSLWGMSGGAITNVGSTDVAITTSLIVPKLKPSANSITAIQLTQANGTTVIVNLDTTNNRLGINNVVPAYDLDITGSARASGTVYGSALQGDSLVPYTTGLFLTISTKPGSSQAIVFKSIGTTPTETMRLTTDGRLGFGVSVPTAQIHIAAGTATLNTAPIKLSSGTLLTAPEVGAIEFLTDAYYATITTGISRKQFAFRETTLSGYGITDAVLKTGDTMTGALQIGVATDNKLILQHNYTTSPVGASYIKWMDESSVLLGTIGLAPTTKALTLTSNASSPLIILNSDTRVINGIQITDATTTITRDGSNNLVFTDVVSGSKTLAQILAAELWGSVGDDIYNITIGGVGIGSLPTAGYKLDVWGDLRYTGKLRSDVSGSNIIEIESKSASGYKFRVYDITSSLNLLHINASGYVGINTNAQVDQFGVVTNTTGIYVGNFTNSHITGKGLYVAGASGTNPSLLVADYQGTALFTITPTSVVATGPISAFNLSGTNTGDKDAYTNATPTPVTIGGILAGTTFTNQTIYAMFNALLYPYQTPYFSSFALSGQATTLECGVYALGGTQTFTWGSTNPTNIQATSLVITDYTTSTPLGSSLPNTGSASLAIGAAVTNTSTNATHSWSLGGTNSNSVAMTTVYFTVTWYSPFYHGVGAAGLSIASLQGLTKVVGARANHTYAFSPTSQKFYYAYPASYGPLTSIIDTNGFPYNIGVDWILTTPTFTNNPGLYEGASVVYNVYESTSLTTQIGFNITFNF